MYTKHLKGTGEKERREEDEARFSMRNKRTDDGTGADGKPRLDSFLN